jgi:hypothetical protein
VFDPIHSYGQAQLAYPKHFIGGTIFVEEAFVVISSRTLLGYPNNEFTTYIIDLIIAAGLHSAFFIKIRIIIINFTYVLLE